MPLRASGTDEELDEGGAEDLEGTEDEDSEAVLLADEDEEDGEEEEKAGLEIPPAGATGAEGGAGATGTDVATESAGVAVAVTVAAGTAVDVGVGVIVLPLALNPGGPAPGGPPEAEIYDEDIGGCAPLLELNFPDPPGGGGPVPKDLDAGAAKISALGAERVAGVAAGFFFSSTVDVFGGLKDGNPPLLVLFFSLKEL